MAEPTQEAGIERKDIRRLTTPGGTVQYGLPLDLLETAIRRLGFLGLVIALMAPSAYLIERFTQPERVSAPGVFPFPQGVAALLFAAGAAICVLAWSRKVPAELMLNLGLVFQVIVALGIALSEHATPWPPEHPIRGISWNCLWIALYLIAIPGTYSKSVLGAVTAACMTPLGLLIATAANRNPMPTPNQLVVLLLPPFVAAAWALPVGRYLYRLGAEVSKARAMGSYELIELIGKGGMGEVWRAKHRMLARAAALKLIRPEMLGLENFQDSHLLLRRFEREARATAGLRSPHTVVVYDYGLSSEGSFYYAMELLDGLDLERLVQRFGPQPAGRAAWLLRQVAKSLAEAHEQGLVHRDVKPRNIFSCRMGTDYDFVKVLDFGLVKIRAAKETQTRLTRAGVTTGTPAYMAPEVAMGKPDVDGRADLYSAGCVGYWLLTGQLVFDSPTAMAMALAHVQTPPVPPSQRTEIEIPGSLERLILMCLEKDPAKRPESARELILLLDACDGLPPWTQQAAELWWRAHIPQKENEAAEMAAAGRDGSA
jgi:serine/threonine-protein kinase